MYGAVHAVDGLRFTRIREKPEALGTCLGRAEPVLSLPKDRDEERFEWRASRDLERRIHC